MKSAVRFSSMPLIVESLPQYLMALYNHNLCRNNVIKLGSTVVSFDVILYNSDNFLAIGSIFTFTYSAESTANYTSRYHDLIVR